jgi:hypothetical protein
MDMMGGVQRLPMLGEIVSLADHDEPLSENE